MTSLTVAFLCASIAPAGETPPDAQELSSAEEGNAVTPEAMRPYREELRSHETGIEMVPIPGGMFVMGSPPDEQNRRVDEGPQHRVEVEPFWMGRFEITWEQYHAWSRPLNRPATRDARDLEADAVTKPSQEYVDMTFGMGHDGFPAIAMSQLAAKTFCEWLSRTSGRYYRLPTEAEWEYACRAGTKTAYSFGDDPAQVDRYAWHMGNCGDTTHKVGTKEPNAWGLYDMHGNVAEWTLDRYSPDFYSTFDADQPAYFPICVPDRNAYPRVLRGGSWYDSPETVRSACREKSKPEMNQQDPNVPQSRWYLIDAPNVGFRVVRPLKPNSIDEIQRLVLYPDVPDDYPPRAKPSNAKENTSF